MSCLRIEERSAIREDEPFKAAKGWLDRLLRVHIWICLRNRLQIEKENRCGWTYHDQQHHTKYCKAKDGYPSNECRRAAELYLLEMAQKDRTVRGAKMLVTNILAKEDILGTKYKIITLGSRGRNEIPRIYNVTELPVLKMTTRP